MRCSWLLCLLFFLFGCAAAVQPPPTLIFEQTATPLATEIVPTAVQPRTRVPRTRNPQQTPEPTMMPQADAQATIVARATASPFPTAQPPVVRSGRPYRVVVERGALRMQIELARDTFMAGEDGQAHITLENRGSETIDVTGGSVTAVMQVVVLDEQGRETKPYPWQPLSMPGQPRWAVIKAGESFSETVAFQIPSADLLGTRTLALWGVARFSRGAPEYGDSGDNLWLQMEAGPLALQIVPPEPAKQAVANLTIDRSGWLLQVQDKEGNALAPAWRYFEAQSANGSMTGMLPPSADGTWKQPWQDHLTANENNVAVRVWVGTPGYLLATTMQTLPGKGAGAREFYSYTPATQTFSDYEAAQQALGLPLWHFAAGTGAGTLEKVQIEDYSYDKHRRTKTSQLYRMHDAIWLELMQENNTERYDSAGWGQARFEADALQVEIDGATGYLVKRLGWWVLDWKRENVGFELRVPIEAMTQERLLEMARSATP